MPNNIPSFSLLQFSRNNKSKAKRRKGQTINRPAYERLEPRQLLAPLINEFVASNATGLVDDNGSTTDWIEIHNDGQTINLAGYSLTDDVSNPSKFIFSNQTLLAQDYLVVFAGDDTDPTSGSDLYTGFGLSSSGEYVGLYDPSGNLVSEFAVGGGDYPAQIADVSYGFIDNGSYSTPSYFSTPTPGSANANPVLGVVQRVDSSVTPGFFDAPFTVSLSTATAGASILYTTDGSTPALSNSSTSAYSGPINISSTTTLRAVAVKVGSLSVVDRTWSYLFLDDILTQSNDGSAPAGWPTSNVNGQQLDYGIDPEVIAIEGAQAIKDSLLAIPSWSITTDLENLFDPVDGIYVNALEDGAAWERPASVELIQPDGSEGFQVNAGIRIRGGFSRNDNNPKHAFRLFFRGEYGDSELNYPVHGDRGTDTFEKIDLRTAQNYSWSKDGNSTNDFITEVISRQNQGLSGQPVTLSSWLHLYVNGQYFGLFQTQERADANFGATYLGGDADNFDVIKPDAGPRGDRLNQATDGNLDAYERLFQQAFALDSDGSTPNFVNDSAYYKAQGLNVDGTRNPNYEVLLDVDNLITYMTEIFYSMNRDAPISGFFGNTGLNNYYAMRDRTGDAGFIFFVHDAEHSLGRRNEERIGPYNNQAFDNDGVDRFNPQSLHQKLMANDEYRLRFADYIQESFFNDGVYTTENLKARWNAEAAKIESAIIAESARWGDAKTSSPLLKSDWEQSIQSRHDGFLSTRNSEFLQLLQNTIIQLRDGSGDYSINQNAPLFPSVSAPDFRIGGTPQHGGDISDGASLSLVASGAVYYTTDGSDPRLPGGGINPNATAYDASAIESTLLDYGAEWNYLDDGSDQGTAWQSSSFDDSSWDSGDAQLGYGNNGEVTTVGFIDTDPNQSGTQKNFTTYFRKTFAATTGNYTAATINILRDDGAVVYLNGVEIARSNMDPGTVLYTTPAAGTIGGSNETTPDQITLDISLFNSLLQNGNNTLAVEVHQTNNGSSDLSFNIQLLVEEPATPSGPITLNTSTNVQARTFSGGQWSALSDATFVIPALQSDLRISEIHFNPANPTAAEIAAGFTDNDDFEFIELFNPSTIGSIDLSGVQLSNGVTFSFGNTSLLPGERAVVVEDVAAFTARYGDSATVLGSWSGGLNNGGEQVTLIDSDMNEIMSVNYGDNDPWYGATDGDGYSLVLDDAVNTPVNELGKHYSWRSSSEFGGTPGTSSSSRLGVVINEILAHTDAPQSDSIELYNPTGQAIDVSFWFLSDSITSPQKFQFPANTVIPSGGYLVYDESDFNPNPANPGVNDFALNSNGDDVVLSRPVLVAGSIGTYVEDSVSFNATFNGESLGRLPNGSGRLTRLASNSFGNANGDAEVGPLVISEINYHPENPNTAALAIDATLTDNDLEYIEIANPTSSSVDLTNWRLRGESDYDFAAGTSLAAGAALIVVSFDPSLAINANKLLAFEAHYGITSELTSGNPTDVTILGALSASLSNSTGRVALQQPDTPDLLGVIPHVVVDEVVYDDLSPWADADGSGQVLERDELASNGNLAGSWIAAAATPGVFEVDCLIGDINQDGVIDFSDIPSFISILQNGLYLKEADINGDGVVDFSDIPVFIDLLINQ